MSLQSIFDKIKQFFPFSAKADDIVGLIISIIIYVIAPVVLGFVFSLVSGIFLLGALAAIIMAAVDIYCVIGIVLAVLIFLKIVK